MDKCDLHTILRSPTGNFYAAGVKTNVLFFARGRRAHANTNTSLDLRPLHPAFFAETGVPWVTSAETRHRLIEHPSEYVTGAAVRAHRLRHHPVGTLVVAMYGDGRTRGRVSELGISATINHACAAVSVDPAKASRDFVKLALEARTR